MQVGILGGGGAPFSPASISGLQLWYKADAITGLNDGDPVATWTDQSGNGRNATQASATLKPLYKTNILNGMAGVLFDGSNDLMSIVYDIPAATSIFIVYSGWSSGSLIGNNGANPDMLQRATTNFPDVNWPSIATSQSMADNKILTMLYNYTSDSYTVRMDGASVGTSAAAADVTTPGAITIGQSYNEPLAGYLHEVILYNAVLSAGNYASVEAYLAARWGVTLG